MESRDWKIKTEGIRTNGAFCPRHPPAATQPGPAPRAHVVAVDVAVGQHHGRVVLVHHVARDLADQTGVGAVGHGQGLCQLVQGAAAHGAVGALGAAVLLVALPGPRVKEGSRGHRLRLRPGDRPLPAIQSPRRKQAESLFQGKEITVSGRNQPEASAKPAARTSQPGPSQRKGAEDKHTRPTLHARPPPGRQECAGTSSRTPGRL